MTATEPRITLKSETDASGYPDLTFTEAQEGELRLIAELVAVLGELQAGGAAGIVDA